MQTINEKQLSNNQEGLKTRLLFDKGFIILKMVKFYNHYFRQLFLIFLIIEPFLLFYTQIGCTNVKIK